MRSSPYIHIFLDFSNTRIDADNQNAKFQLISIIISKKTAVTYRRPRKSQLKGFFFTFQVRFGNPKQGLEYVNIHIINIKMNRHNPC